MKEISLREPWEKAFSDGNIILVEVDNIKQEMKVLKTFSYFGEYIDKIDLENIKDNSIQSFYLQTIGSVKFYEK